MNARDVARYLLLAQALFIIHFAALGSELLLEEARVPAVGPRPAPRTATSAPAAPLLESIFPAPGSAIRELETIEVQFDQPVLGVDAEDLLANGQGPTTVPN